MNEKSPHHQTGPDQAHNSTEPVIDPAWCHINRCTATPDPGGEHHNTPTRLSVPALIGHLEVTASIVQSHAAWLTEPNIMVEFTGLLHNWLPVSGSVELTRDGATSLAQLLAQVAGTTESTFAEQIADHPAIQPQRGPR